MNFDVDEDELGLNFFIINPKKSILAVKTDIILSFISLFTTNNDAVTN